jgi:hypothetical protein
MININKNNGIINNIENHGFALFWGESMNKILPAS